MLDDPTRLAALRRASLLDTVAEEGFDRLTRLATTVLGVPVSLVSLVDADRQFFKSAVGLAEPWASARQTPLSHSFCRHVVATGQPLVVEDARADPLFRDNLAVPDLGVVAYAGIPLVTSAGQTLGTFCAIDHHPRVWSERDLAILRDLAGAAMTEIELRTAVATAGASEAKFAKAFGLSPIVLTLTALDDGQFVEVNETFVRRTGYGRDEAIGRTPVELGFWLRPDDRETGRAALRSGGTIRDGEVRFRMKGGTVRDCLVSAEVVEIEGRACVLSAIVDVTERKRAEDRFRALAEASTRVIWTADAAGELRDPAARWHALVGVAPDDYRAAEWLTWVHPDDRAAGDRAWREAVALGRPLEFEQRVRREDGEERRYLVRAVPIREPDGTVREWVGADLDVTERTRLEERLRLLAEAGEVLASSLDYQSRLETVARLAVPVLADWCVVDVLEADGLIHRLAIAHRDPALVETADELVRRYPVLAADSRHTSARVLASGRPWLDPAIEETRFVAEARDPAHLALLRRLGFRAEMVVPMIANGQPIGAITLALADASRRYDGESLALAEELARRCAVAIDNARLYRAAQRELAERTAAEAALRASERFVQHVVAVVPSAVYVHDLEAGAEVFVNRAAASALGHDPDDPQAPASGFLSSAVHPDDRARVAAHLGHVADLADGETATVEYRMRHADGDWRWFASQDAVFARGPDGRARQIIGAATDVSERKRAEAERRAFLDAVAHDLKSPVAVIKGQAQILARRVGQGRQLEADWLVERLAILARGADRIALRIDELTDAARLEAGQPLELRLRPVDLGELVVRSAEEARLLGDGHAIRVEAAAGDLIGEWDEVRLERVVANLLGNAVKYSPAGGEVAVGLRREGRWAILTVADRGIGIPAADLPHVFAFRRRGGNVGAIRGTGIGLAGVKQIVELHGGTIAVESAVGIGSTFTVRLPLAK